MPVRVVSAVLRYSLLAILACVSLHSVSDEANPGFEAWLEQLRQDALARGISERTVKLAFADITPPVERIIETDRNQAEVVETYDDYLGKRLSDWKTRRGLTEMDRHSDLLEQVASDYQVQPRFLVAVWGMETNYGTFPITEPLFNVLATLAYDERRGAFFRKQFMAALTMLDRGYSSYEQMKSSWAGAMGQSQFMPTSYLRYAVDYDGDGKRDIWDSEADVFASIANYFGSRHWRFDQTWGRPVTLPDGGETALAAPQSDGMVPADHCARFKTMGAWRRLSEWQALGVRRADGSDLPTRDLPAALIVGDKGDGEGYLVYRNFCTIMSFNPSFKYALSIGLLADAIDPDKR